MFWWLTYVSHLFTYKTEYLLSTGKETSHLSDYLLAVGISGQVTRIVYHATALKFKELPRISKKKKKVKMAVSSVQKFLENMENFGNGMRQKSDTTKENAGSLLQYLNIYEGSM